MAVRPARFGDIPSLAALLEEGYQRSKYRDRCHIDIKEAKALLVSAIQRHGLKTAGGSCVFVSDDDGVVDGFSVGRLERVYQIADKLSANDVFFYVASGAHAYTGGALIDKFINWATNNPEVIQLQLSATDIIQEYEKTARLYRRNGFAQSGVIYERSADL